MRTAAVVAREDPAGEKRLIAYLVPNGRAPGPDELRAFLRQRLPEFMVPSAYVAVEEFPLSPNGKVDRRALPAPPDSMAGLKAAFVPPAGPIEELLATIWMAVLRVGRVGIHDNFFELGGHSLLATQVMSRIVATLGVELPLRALFEAPTVAGLAARLAAAQQSGAPAEAPALVPVARQNYRMSNDGGRQE